MSKRTAPALTKHRQAVFQVIEASDDHLTANEVFAGARLLLPGISFATVYNSLRYLKNEGLIGEVSFAADATRYDKKTARHDHAICGRCGKLVDIDLPVPAEMIKKGERLTSFKVDSVEIVLRGKCPDCINTRS